MVIVMLKILSIGNSFSQDAHRYLHGVCEKCGKEIHNANLYIGGCTLERHANNLINNESSYLLEIHGESTKRLVSIDEALSLDDWDIVTLQQASTYSFNFSTFEPHIHILAEHIRKVCPKAKIAIHQTWSYEDGSQYMANVGKKDHKNMFCGIQEAYKKAFDAVNADILIPSGVTFDILQDKGFKVHRDTFHARYGFGRYALSLTWMKTLFGKDTVCEGFDTFDEPVSDEEKAAAEQSASTACAAI